MAESFRPISKEILCIIPKFDGDEKLLNLFITKSEYVISGSAVEGNLEQNLYLFHAVTSRLTGRAASLLSDHPEIATWEELKNIFTQHFGDPRSEECIAIELENLKIKQGESYIQFCHRIQNVKSSLFSKVNRLIDEGVKAAKMIIYNNTALNVFLYNLPEDMLRIVRLKTCSTLEHALSVVTEEVNFQFQYNAKNKTKQQSNSQNQFKAALPIAQGFKPAFNVMPQNNNFKFGIPQNNFKFGIPQYQGVRPNFIQHNRFAPTQGFRFGSPQNMPQRNFGQGHSNQFRTPYQQGGFKFGIPQQQQGFRFGVQNPPQWNSNQYKFGIQHPQQAPRQIDTDVSMRTAPVRQNMIANDLYYIEEPSPCPEYVYSDYDHDYLNYLEYPSADCENPEVSDEKESNNIEIVEPENFQTMASSDSQR